MKTTWTSFEARINIERTAENVRRARDGLRDRFSTILACFSVAVMIGIPGLAANAGSLEPAPGVPQPTMKTLTEIEPRKGIAQPPAGPAAFPIVINQPGSYYLMSDITGVSGQNGISITVDNVTLDLNGFAIVGANSATGVEVSAGRHSVTIRNGTVRSWSNGILAVTSTGVHFIDLVVSNNSTSGILGGSDSLVTQCTVRLNADRGIQINSGIVERCTASSNNIGITVTDGAVRNSAALNNASGIVAIRSVVDDCVASSNTGDGFFISTGKLVNSVARSNGGDGIEAIGESLVIGNVSTSNGTAGTGAGIHCTGDKNHIEGNNVANNDVGIDTNDTGIENNVVIRNSAACNTSNYDSGVNNQIGTIGSLTTIGSNPWGNISMTGFCS